MRHYELVVVLSPILSQEEAAGEWDRIKSLVHRNGGGDPYEERWGMRRLAYPIKKAGQTFLEGNYLLTRFSSDTVVPPELEGHLRLSESVLRYLLTKSGPPESTPPVAADGPDGPGRRNPSAAGRRGTGRRRCYGPGGRAVLRCRYGPGGRAVLRCRYGPGGRAVLRCRRRARGAGPCGCRARRRRRGRGPGGRGPGCRPGAGVGRPVDPVPTR